jgi:hypothetical protein
VIQRATTANYSGLLIQLNYAPPSIHATRVNRLPHAIVLIVAFICGAVGKALAGGAGYNGLETVPKRQRRV